MISPDTLAAALRVDQHAARRAMQAARSDAAEDSSEAPAIPAGPEPASADDGREAVAGQQG